MAEEQTIWDIYNTIREIVASGALKQILIYVLFITKQSRLHWLT